MDEKIKARCQAYFKAANKAQHVYVAGDKLFIDEGAAQSYGEVLKVKRTDVMEAEPKEPKRPEDAEEKLNHKIES